MIVTTRRLAAATAAAAILITLVWYVAAFGPQSARLSKAHTQFAAASVKVGDLQTQVATLQALVRQIPSDSVRLAQLNAAVPPAADLKDVLVQLDTLASRSRVQLTSLSPAESTAVSAGSPASQAGGVRTITLPMSVSGSYPALTSFLTGLEQMPRALVVNSISLSPSGTGNMLASLQTKVFYAA